MIRTDGCRQDSGEVLHVSITLPTSRSIVWLQNQRDANAERARSGARGLGRGLGGAEELHEFRVGRIKHERVKVIQQFITYCCVGYLLSTGLGRWSCT